MNIVTISNITTEPFLAKSLSKHFADYQITYAALSLEEIYDGVSKAILQSADYIIVLIRFSEYFKFALFDICDKVAYKRLFDMITEKTLALYDYLKLHSQGYIIWFGYEGYDDKLKYILGHTYLRDQFIDDINVSICKRIYEKTTYIDLKALVAELGIDRAYSNKNKYRWNAPFSTVLLERISGEIYKQYQINQGITKKCIVLDCDNVLWRGILSEDGIEQIKLGDGLGRSYQDFQRFLLTLYNHGVILAICSKNDESDVLRVFREHSGMILKEEHIACFQVNWDNKADNIRQLASELNIGLDSIVFIDDSEFEINMVKELLPEVTAILYDRDTVYENLSCFNLKNKADLEGVKQRARTYQTNHKREALRKESSSFDEYLQSLELAVDVHKALPVELARISELTQRTNRCTNGTRYTIDQLKEKLNESCYQLYSVFVSDKFSNLGLVGVIGIEGDSLDLFSLSCRALGRKVEDSMLEFTINKKVSGFRFTSTSKNHELYLKLKQNYREMLKP